MQVFRSINEASPLLRQGTAITIGSFDGIHIGHRSIIRGVADHAHQRGLKAVLITFDPHAQRVLSPADAPPLLTTTVEKMRLIEEMSLDAVLVLKFTKELSEVSAAAFLQQYLMDGLFCRSLVFGLNHTFGHRREGNIDFLRANQARCGYDLIPVEPVMYDSLPVRSSRIRREIRSGDYAAALEMLGHDFEMCGQVVHGKGAGRSMGFPTINVKLSPDKIVPPVGVYAAYTFIGANTYPGMMYVGENGQQFALEVNLFDYNGDLYGKQVSVFPTRFVRQSIRFSDNHELARQIEKDETKIRNIFNINQT